METRVPFQEVAPRYESGASKQHVCSTIALDECTGSLSGLFHKTHYGRVLISTREIKEYLYWFGFQEVTGLRRTPIEDFVRANSSGTYCLAGWDPIYRAWHAIALVDGVLIGEYYPDGMQVQQAWRKSNATLSRVAESVAARLCKGIYVNFLYERMREEREIRATEQEGSA